MHLSLVCYYVAHYCAKIVQKNEGHNKLSMMGRFWTNHLGPARKAREAACPRKPA